MSHLFSSCPQSFACEEKKRTGSAQVKAQHQRAHEPDGCEAWKVSPEGVLTVSKLPLCMSSIGGRNRSARVLSFLSTVPLRSSCSWRTTTRRIPVVKGRKAAGEEAAKRLFLGDLLVSVWKSLKPSKMDRAGLLRFGTAEKNPLTFRRWERHQLADNRSDETQQRALPPNNGSGSTRMSCF